MELPGVANVEDFMAAKQADMDATLLVRFFIHPQHDKAASLEAGRAIYKDTEYIEIRTPGHRDAVIRPARPQDRQRFPRHYEAFQKRVEDPETGTPLAEWPMITRSVAEELAFINIKTVEALANVADSASSNFKGLLNLKRQAKEWIELAETDAPLGQLHEELRQSKSTIEVQQRTIDELTKRLDALEKSNSSLPETELDQAGEEPPPETPLLRRSRRRRVAAKE